MQTLQGLGDDGTFSSILSSVGAAATPALQSEAEQIIVPIVAPYLIGLVVLSFVGLAFGVAAYKKVNRLTEKKSTATP